MTEEKIDLFEKLIRFLAIKPLPEDNFDLEKAREVIKEENKDDITFIGQHGYFEDVLDTVEQRIGNLRPAESSLFIYIKGESSKSRIERNLLNIILNVDHIYIVGTPQEWRINDPKIKFIQIEDIFTDNHQRYLIFRSPTYNVALVSRHSESNDEDKRKIEAALTNKKEAVALLTQIIGTKIYRQN
jgi:hypothetical protein